MRVTAAQKTALQKIEKTQPLSEKNAGKVLGPNHTRTFDALYSKGLVGRNRPGRAGDIVITDAAREILNS